ncbi:Peroxin-14 [Cladobotryum mycophilum]|uniref:Peroxisomal membrane protein PEX14 n=1 Tax=Cladobotryum mycophilum TaxID=491253 RepID=A0ABR0S6P5_9HYPO
MAIREDLVTSAAQFLQDPSVASSSVENKISFLRTKNLTQEEIGVALARSGNGAPPGAPYPGGPSGPPQYYQQYPQYAWQPPQAPKRDWRDWFIMATVVGGVSYGLYSLGKRYVYPLVAPPTPERLEQDKKTIEEQFDKAFSLVDQLSKDTEALKEAEKQRTEKLDTTLSDLETVMTELKAASRRREDDAQRIRDEVQALKDAIPKAMSNQKDLTDNRLYLPRINGTSPSTIPTPSRAATVTNETSTTAPTETSATPAVEPPKSLAQSSFNRVSGSSIGSGAKASIPAWQMAMANKAASTSTPSTTTTPVVPAVETPKEPETAAASSS